MLKEFKTFALKGNMLDMAVGIIIGGAFGKEAAPKPPPEPPQEEVLLTEIRDLLKSGR